MGPKTEIHKKWYHTISSFSDNLSIGLICLFVENYNLKPSKVGNIVL